MKTNKDGIKIVKNDASLYVNGRMQYQAVNLAAEYGTELNGCKYAVASKHCQKKMEKRFSKSLDEFRPYIFLTRKEYAAILKAQNNESKFRMRGINFHDPYGYTGELTEILHDCEIICADPEPDPLTAIIEKEEDALRRRQIAALPKAMEMLTDTQRRRMKMHFYDGMTIREIAEAEGTYKNAIDDSIRSAKKKIADYLKKVC